MVLFFLEYYPMEDYSEREEGSSGQNREGHPCVSVKRFYARTNKNNFEKQIARQVRRQGVLRRMVERDPQATVRPSNEDNLPLTDPEQHHYISKTQRHPLNISKWTK